MDGLTGTVPKGKLQAPEPEVKPITMEEIPGVKDDASSASDEGWTEADSIPAHAPQEDEDDAPPVELETRIVTEVLSADLNPFNIEERD